MTSPHPFSTSSARQAAVGGPAARMWAVPTPACTGPWQIVNLGEGYRRCRGGNVTEGERSFWDRLFSGSFLEQHDHDRERKVLEYICHRIGEGAHLRDVVQEEYVRRNASQVEIEDILENPRLVEAAHEQMRSDFSSGRL